MKTKSGDKQRAMQELKEVSKTVKGLVDEVRVQVHLGAMELKDEAGPYWAEVTSASKSASRDLVKRAQQLQRQLAKLRAAHRVG